jgi:hypothetical protein
MNYFELINKCLVELNYKQVSDFSELTKNEHKKLKNILNVLNTEICLSDRWNFLQRKMEVTLPKNTGEIENPIEGRIEMILVDGCKFDYCQDFEKFFVNSQPANTYSFYNDKILLPIFNQPKRIEILYYTKNCAKDNDGNEKFSMENYNDVSLIPLAFAEPLLVYGTCLRLKGNPQHVRFSYWLSMYKDALANMRSRISASMDDEPNVVMFRR